MCRFCQTGISPEHFHACPFCAEMIRKNASFCRYCKANVSQRRSAPEVKQQAQDKQEQPPEVKQEEQFEPFQLAIAETDDNTPASFKANTKLIRQREKIIIAELSKEFKSGVVDDETQEQIRALIRKKVTEDIAPLTMMEKGILLQNVLDEIFGFGPLGPLLRDPTVKDIYVNAHDEIFVVRKDELMKTTVEFENTAHLKQTIDKIVVPLGYQFDESHPIVDLRLPNLARVNITMSTKGPTLSIRFYGIPRIYFPELVSRGTLSQAMSEFLEACVKARVNILIGGPNQSGKSSLLGALLNSTDKDERIITIENEAELNLNRQENVIQLLSSPGNATTGKGEITLAKLVGSAKQMLPGRVAMGELTADGTAELLDLMHTDIDGVMTTVKSNSSTHSLDRLEIFLLQGKNKLSSEAAKHLIASSVQLVITLKRYEDGIRRISEIAELKSLKGEHFILNPLFSFEQKMRIGDGPIKGKFVPGGKLPGFHQKFSDMNVHFNPEWMF